MIIKVVIDLSSLHLILIDMFIIRSSLTSRLSKHIAIFPFSSSSSILFSARGTGYNFGSSKWNKKEFLKKLDKQIMDSHAQIIWSNPASEAYFSKKHWKIKYIEDKTMFEYSKMEPHHQIRVLAHVMYAPPNDPDHAEQANAQKDDPNKKLNYAQVAIYIRRKGTEKWLTAEMAVMEGSIDLTGVFFTTLQPNFSWKKNMYPGPRVQTLPLEIVDVINRMFSEFGLTTEVLMNMVLHASIMVDPLDLEWLKSIREMWG